MRFFFAVTSLAVICVALSGMSLSWDGSFYLFTILDTRAPFAPNNRLVDFPLHWLFLTVAQFTSNLTVLRIGFGLVYAAVVIGSLALSWWIVRDNKYLFVWAALGVCLGTILLQCHPTNEGFLAILFAWPVFLAVLVQMRRKHVPVVILLSAAIFFAHPFASPLFAIATTLSLATALRFRSERRKMLLWTLGFAVAAALSVLRFSLVRTAYEAEQLSVDVVVQHFRSSMAGLPLVALLLAWLVGCLIFTEGLLAGRKAGGRALRILYGVELFSIVSVAVLLVVWAIDLYNWRDQQDFRTLLLFSSLPFFGLAGLDSMFQVSGSGRNGENWLHRARTVQAVGVVFLLVLSIQSLGWFNMTRRLENVLAQSPWSCISQASIEWISRTPMRQWQLTPYSLLLQDRSPTSIILAGDSCGETAFERGIYIYPSTLRQWAGRWFDLSLLRDRIIAEQSTPRGCSLMLTSGWYRTERRGANWWRWSGGSGNIQVLVEKPVEARLIGKLESMSEGNKVDIIVNGTQQARIEVDWDGMQAFEPLSISLQPGQNSIEFASQNPAVTIATDTRPLAIAVGNLSLDAKPAYPSCEMH